MNQIRRYYIPNAIVFITQVVQDRHPVFRDQQYTALLRRTLHQVKRLYPFSMIGYVFLPEHFHMLIKPGPTVTFSQIMHSLKPNFTKAYKRQAAIQGSMHLWQRRFWDHVIRSETDLYQHLDYIHYNPVKHGLARRPEDWADSSYQEWKRRGAYEDQWGWSVPSTVRQLEAQDLE